MHNVYYWSDVYNSLERFSPYQESIQELLQGEYKKLHLKKLKGNYEPPIYSIRLNDKDRLLFTTYKQKLCLLDVILEHDYQKCRFLRHPQLLKKFLAQVISDIERVEEIEFDDVEQGIDLAELALDAGIDLQALEPHQRKLLEFSPTQTEALKIALPALINGSPGAGKTCVAKAMIVAHLRDYPSQKVLYLTKSKKLAHKVLTELTEELQGCEPYLEHVRVATYDEIIQSEIQAGKTLIEDELTCFTKWAAHHVKQTQSIFSDKAKLFWELRQLSGLTLEQYKQLGAKQSLVEKQDTLREDIYAIYESYQRFLSSTHVLSSSFFENKKSLDFELIVVDEAQDLSSQQLINLSHYAQAHQICYFLGDHQILFDGISKHSIIKDILYKGKINQLHMPECYRLPQTVADFTNQVIRLKRLLVGGKADKAESDRIESALELDLQGSVAWLDMSNQANLGQLQAFARSPHTAVLTYAQDLDFFESLLGTPKVFTTEVYKGLEDENIILAGLFNCEQVDEISRTCRKTPEQDLKGSCLHRSAAGQLNESLQLIFNVLITAMTRTKKNLLILEDMQNPAIRRRVEAFYKIYAAIETNHQNSGDEKQPEVLEQDWLQEVRRLHEEGHEDMAKKVFFTKVKACQDEYHALIGKQAIDVSEEKSCSMPEVEKVIEPKLIMELNKLAFNFSTSRLRVLINLFNLHHLFYEKLIQLMPETPKLSLLDLLLQDPEKQQAFLQMMANDTHLLLNFSFKDMLRQIPQDEGFFKNLKQLDKIQHTFLKIKKNSPQALIKCHSEKLHSPLFILALQNQFSQIDTLLELGLQINVDDLIQHGLIETAVMQGNCTLIKKAHEEWGVCLLDPRNHPERLVHRAVIMNKPQVIEMLHQSGLDINFPYTEKPSAKIIIDKAEHETPIFMSIKHQRYECFKKLLELGADLSIADKDGDSVLHAAVYFLDNPENYLKMLLHHKADINVRNHLEMTPLFMACRKDNLDAFNLLLKFGADVNINAIHEYSLYHAVAVGGAKRIFNRLLELKLSLNLISKKGETPAHVAAENGKHQFVKELIKWRPEFLHAKDINEDCLMHMAGASGSIDMMQFLMHKGLSIDAVNAREETALFYAANHGHVNLIDFAYSRGANLKVTNFNGDTIAQAALIGKQSYVFSYLIANRPDLFASLNHQGKSVIHLACEYANYRLLNLNGIDFDIEDSSGRTIVHYFAQDGYVEFYSNKRINWAKSDNDGNTVAHYAVKYLQNHFLEFMSGINLISMMGINHDGDTLVHTAARHNNLKVLTYLFTQGVEFDSLNKAQKSAKDLALEAGFVETAARIDELLGLERDKRIKFFNMFTKSRETPELPPSAHP